MTLALGGSSSGGMTKFARPATLTPTKSKLAAPSTTMIPSNDPLHLSPSRSSSLGKKRPRESDGDSKTSFRRTKSVDVSNLGGSRSEKDRDHAAFQKSLIAVFVPNALRESLTGNLTNYNDLVSHFSPPATSTSSSTPSMQPALPLLKAITANVNLLSPDYHGSLVSAILALPWATGEEKFVRAFVGFAGVLISAQPAWVKEVVNAAVKGLAWRELANSFQLAQLTFPVEPVMLSSISPVITRRMYHAHYHLLISHLLSLVPTLPSVLQPLLVRHFPHRREPEVAQTTWVRNCCELVGYCPEIGQRMWSEVIDRMLRIDVSDPRLT